MVKLLEVERRKMTLNCGTDIINVARVKETIEKLGNNFLKRVYTDEEISYCESRRMCKYECYAVRFAAKEAVIKALSSKQNFDWEFKDIEVKNADNGRPFINLHGGLKELFGEEKIDLSLSHEREFAIAMVIVE